MNFRLEALATAQRRILGRAIKSGVVSRSRITDNLDGGDDATAARHLGPVTLPPPDGFELTTSEAMRLRYTRHNYARTLARAPARGQRFEGPAAGWLQRLGGSPETTTTPHVHGDA